MSAPSSVISNSAKNSSLNDLTIGSSKNEFVVSYSLSNFSQASNCPPKPEMSTQVRKLLITDILTLIDMDYLNLKSVKKAVIKDDFVQFTILPFEYLDGRNPRLPRKSSKHYKLRQDIKFIFDIAFESISNINTDAKYTVKIDVYNGSDRLGTADLDNYCKAILDGITHT